MLSEKNEIKLQVYISERLISDLDKVSNSRGMSRAQVVRMMLELGLDCHNDLSNLGVTRMMDFFTRTKEALELLRELDNPDSIQVVDEEGNVI